MHFIPIIFHQFYTGYKLRGKFSIFFMLQNHKFAIEHEANTGHYIKMNNKYGNMGNSFEINFVILSSGRNNILYRRKTYKK